MTDGVPTSQNPGRPFPAAPRWVRALFVATVAGLLVFLARAAGLIQGSRWLDEVLYVGLFAGAAAIIAGRAWHSRIDRAAWACVAAGFACWGLGFALYATAVKHVEDPPSPSVADAAWLALYPFLYVALVLLARGRLQRLYRAMWLDGAIIALTLTALAAPGIIEPVVRSTSDVNAVATAVALAYPLGDTLVLITLAGVLTLLRWRMEPVWVLLGLAFSLNAVADLLYVREVAEGGYVAGTLLDVSWPAAALLAAAAAWQTPRPTPLQRLDEGRALVPPIVASAVAMALLVYGNFAWLPTYAVSLAIGALALTAVRVGLTVRETHRLRGLATTDSLTGLVNHREFHEAVDARLSYRNETPFAVIVFDIDGFKRINDDYGHAEGDRILRQVAGVLRARFGAHDVLARLGGDEFGVLLAEGGTTAHAGAESVKRAIEALDAGIGMSSGIAEWPADGPTKEQLLLRADMALYEAKPAGHDRRRLHAAAVVSSAPGTGDTVGRVLVAAREQLGMQVAYFSEFTGGDQVFRRVDGEAGSFGLQAGAGLPLEDSYCQRVVDGRLPNVIRDVEVDERVCNLDVTRDASLGAYVGVPIYFSDGRLYGTLCCASHHAEPGLAQRDVDFMHVLARVLGEQLEHEEVDTRERALQSQTAGLRGVLAALDARDRYTGDHSESVLALARLVGHHVRLPEDELATVEQVALLHDVGKIGIPDAVLQKRGPLSDHEWRLMRQHPEIGAGVVAAIAPLAHLAPMIRAEHERWDGAGYPDGLAGSAIPLASRIVLVCDAYHAMTSTRPYRKAMPLAAARRELEANAGTQFDPEVVEALLCVIERRRRCRSESASETATVARS